VFLPEWPPEALHFAPVDRINPRLPIAAILLDNGNTNKTRKP